MTVRMARTDVDTTTTSGAVTERIRNLRRQHGWPVERLAKECAANGAPELTTAVIANIESGRPGKDGRRRRHITVDELLTFARVLNVSVMSLLTGGQEEPETGDAISVLRLGLALPADDRQWVGQTLTSAPARTPETGRDVGWPHG